MISRFDVSKIVEPKEFYFPLRGGLDEVTSPYQVRPGKMVSCLNYEIADSGGYKPIDGYERVDGKGLPSSAVFQKLIYVSTVFHVAENTIITGTTSGAVGISLYSGIVDFGAGDIDTSGTGTFLVDGTFITGETIKVSGSVVATILEALSINADDADDKELYAHWKAVEKKRSLVAAVPGSGPIRGVWRFNSDLYAFRDNEAGTACRMYREHAVTGWALVTTPVLLPGGSYQFENTNFGGSASTIKMYGCDGKNKAFEFNGTTFTQVSTGMTVDAPILICEHKKHLFLAFPGGSLQHSPPTAPTGTWSVVVNAGELGLGEEIVSIKNLPGDVLGVWCKDSIQLLSGTGVGNWVLSSHSKDSGAMAGTVQNAGKTLFINNTGLAELAATSAFGSFRSSSVNNLVRPLINNAKNRYISSVAVLAKGQYRVFLNDGGMIVASIIGKDVEFTYSHYDDVVRCVSAPARADDELGSIFFGSDNGFVFKMDSGVSLDALPMTAYFKTPYSFQGATRQLKRYREVTLEIETLSQGETRVCISPDFALTDSTLPT
ncbi:MAG: hypothetical protein JZU65_16165, partial [Chlorobium sp.]|nr:hypothetical protein [Chlorobium sp.]